MCIRDRRGPRKDLNIGTLELSRGVFCATFHAESESEDEVGDRRGPKSRNREVANPNPQSANPRNPLLLRRGKPGKDTAISMGGRTRRRVKVI
eukprot:6781297-Alexandrium_andersonii.AAC.1